MASVSLRELLLRIEAQQAEIDDLRARLIPGAGNEQPARTGISSDRPMSRRGVLKVAAAGTAGLVGAVMLEPNLTAEAAGPKGPAAFASSSSKAAVNATNTGTGNAVSATADGGTSIHGSQKSAAAGAVAVRGSVDNAKSKGGVGVAGLAAVGTGVSGSSTSGIGVSGSSSSGKGVSGSSTSETGVSGTSSSGDGVSGSSTTASGVAGSSHSGTGVSGSSTSGAGVAASSGTGTAVTGTSGSAGAGATAILGTISSTSPGGSSAGVYGANNGTGGSGIGVYGSQNGFGWGVYGTTPSGVGVFGYCSSGYGVQGSSSSGSGVYASSTSGKGVDAFSSSNIGVHGLSGSSTGVQGESSSGYGVYASSPNNYAVVGVTTSGNALYGQVSTNSQAGVIGRTLNASGNWAMYAFGNIGATGTKSAIVPAADGKGHLTLYCMESPECWFEDFGSGTLSKGAATVKIDPEFAQTVDTGEYHVFLQPEGECKGLSVRDRTPAGFEVREAEGGASDVRFSYRIVALRKDVVAPRLRRASLPQAAVAAVPDPELIANRAKARRPTQ